MGVYPVHNKTIRRQELQNAVFFNCLEGSDPCVELLFGQVIFKLLYALNLIARCGGFFFLFVRNPD